MDIHTYLLPSFLFASTVSSHTNTHTHTGEKRSMHEDDDAAAVVVVVV